MDVSSQGATPLRFRENAKGHKRFARWIQGTVVADGLSAEFSFAGNPRYSLSCSAEISNPSGRVSDLFETKETFERGSFPRLAGRFSFVVSWFLRFHLTIESDVFVSDFAGFRISTTFEPTFRKTLSKLAL